MFENRQLVVTAIGTDKTGIVSELTKVISQCNCNILDSRMALFGSEFTFIMLLSGDAQAISRVEHVLPISCQEIGLLTMSKPTSRHEAMLDRHVWQLELCGPDKHGMVSEVSTMLADNDVHIAALKTNCFSPDADQQQEFGLNADDDFTIAIYDLRLDENLATDDLKQRMVTFCEELGMAAMITENQILS